MRLLTSDWHLTDNEFEDYRWKIFDSIRELALQSNVTELFHLGDLTDRKDRHSGRLVNRLIREMIALKLDAGLSIIILMGNHDAPLNSVPYWKFLNDHGITYIVEPTVRSHVLLLPFSSNPRSDWEGIDLHDAEIIMMHQTLGGSIVDGGRVIEKDPHPMPILPRGIPIFSGDVHRPQRVGPVTYVGAPHPVRFSEDWQCRVILVGNKKEHEVFVHSINRAIVEISSAEELKHKRFKEHDQVRIRYKLESNRLSTLPVEEQAVRKWADDRGVTIASFEAILVDDITHPEQQKVEAFEMMKPDDVVRDFGQQEKLDQTTLDVGLQIIEECK